MFLAIEGELILSIVGPSGFMGGGFSHAYSQLRSLLKQLHNDGRGFIWS